MREAVLYGERYDDTVLRMTKRAMVRAMCEGMVAKQKS